MKIRLPITRCCMTRPATAAARPAIVLSIFLVGEVGVLVVPGPGLGEGDQAIDPPAVGVHAELVAEAVELPPAVGEEVAGRAFGLGGGGVGGGLGIGGSHGQGVRLGCVDQWVGLADRAGHRTNPAA